MLALAQVWRKHLSHVSFVSVGNIGNDGSVAAKAFGRWVRDLRNARGWTQEAFAERLAAAGYPLHQTSIAKLESGSRPTPLDEVGAIARIFGVDHAALLGAVLFGDSAEDEAVRRLELREIELRQVAITEERDAMKRRHAELDAESKVLTARREQLKKRVRDGQR